MSVCHRDPWMSCYERTVSGTFVTCRCSLGGLDEVFEAIGLFYVLLVELLNVLVSLERGLTAVPKPDTRLVRELSRQWLNDANTEGEPVMVWLGRTSSWDPGWLSRKLHLSSTKPSACCAWPAITRSDLASGAPTRNGVVGHEAEVTFVGLVLEDASTA